MIKEQNVPEARRKQFEDWCLGGEYIGAGKLTRIFDLCRFEDTYSSWNTNIAWVVFQAFADALTKPLEEANRQLRNIIDEENKDHIEQQAELKEENARLEHALNTALEKITEQQKELDDCKDAVVMLYDALGRLFTEAKYQSNKGGWDNRHELEVAENALSATSAIVEGYKK